MAFGLGIPCGACGCDPPCDPCTRTCQNPHTGTEFEAVFTRYFEGAESGNVSDGYLSASGDSDTSDPYDGMDGSGPWHQQITGSFTLNSTQTRFPCRVTVSFWRNNYTLGAATIPPASTALTSQKVYVTVTAGAVVVGDLVIVPADGEVHIETVSVPLVSGGGDQSANIPRFYDGSVSVAPQCESASFSIRARIEWNTQKRQHVLYGLVRECYETGTPCATFCSGSPPPATLYLTISNYTGPALASGTPNGTYVLDRVPNYCNWYLGGWEWGCTPSPQRRPSPVSDEVSAYMDSNASITAGSWQIVGGDCRLLVLWVNTSYNPTTLTSFCGTGVLASGTNGVVLLATAIPVTSGDIVSGSFDWELEA